MLILEIYEFLSSSVLIRITVKINSLNKKLSVDIHARARARLHAHTCARAQNSHLTRKFFFS